MAATTDMQPAIDFAPGSLVRARGREWVVLPGSDEHMLLVRPLGGGEDDGAAILRGVEHVESASFSAPTAADLGDASSAAMLQTALRIGFRATAGPFRSLARLSVEPRAYQFVPLLLALRQETTRLLIADDVGIGKTIEAGLVAAELLAQGDVQRLAVLCSPALAEQWQRELRDKFGIDAELVIPSTVNRLTRGLLLSESLFERYPFVVVSTDFIKSHQRRQEFINHCPELVIVDEAHGAVADGGGAGRVRTQRYDLLRALSKDRARHLILVTATPHSGKEEGFRNLIGLLDPDLATLDLEQVKGRELLAKHMVQRRRGDIRRYLNEETQFPSDRQIADVPYTLTKEYAALFEKVLDYAREQVAALGRHRTRSVNGFAGGRCLHSCERSPLRPAPLRRRFGTGRRASVPRQWKKRTRSDELRFSMRATTNHSRGSTPPPVPTTPIPIPPTPRRMMRRTQSGSATGAGCCDWPWRPKVSRARRRIAS